VSLVIAANDKIGLFLFTVRRASFAFPWTEESLAKEVECSKVIQWHGSASQVSFKVLEEL